MTRYHHLLMDYIVRMLKGVSAIDKSVLIALASYTDELGAAYPTLEQLAERSGFSKRTVSDAVKRSVEARLITRLSGHTGRANTYRFTCLLEHSDCTDAVSAPPATQEGNIINIEYNHLELLPSSNNPTSWIASPATIEATFAEFWVAYPRKQDKPHAKLAFILAAQRFEINVIMGGLKRFLESEDALRELCFIPLAHNWLTGERWEDEYD